jgi:hypothetical protein
MRDHTTHPWLSKHRRASAIAGALLGVLASSGVLAQTAPRTTTPVGNGTASQAVIARSGRYVYPESSLNDLLDIDSAVLESPLSATEQAQIRALAIDEFNRDPAKIAAVLPQVHNAAQLFRTGRPFEKAVAREKDWENMVKQAPSDPIAARALDIMSKHVPIIVTGNGLVVTAHQVNALFTSSDIIAEMSGQPKSTPQQRMAYLKALPAQFPKMTPVEQEQVAHAERRLVAAVSCIYYYSDLRAKATAQVRNNVHGPDDLPREARRLEDWGIKFEDTFQTYMNRQAAINGQTPKQLSAEQINIATRQFMGQGR